MKTVIGDYFAQSSEEKKGDHGLTSSMLQSDHSDPRSDADGIPISDDRELKVDGKEKAKAKGKSKFSKYSKQKPKGIDNKYRTQAQAPNGHRDKQFYAHKKASIEENSTQVDVDFKEDARTGLPPHQSFALKIRMKSKVQSSPVDSMLIEESSSPEQVPIVCDENSKALKSPNGTMFKYLISQKSAPAEKECVAHTMGKVNRDISDFFSPSKKRDACTTGLTSKDGEKEDELDSAELKGSKNVDECIKVHSTVRIKAKSSRRTKKSLLSASKSQQVDDATIPSVSDSVSAELKTSCNRGKPSSTKSKSLRKSLSLSKIDMDTKLVDTLLQSEKFQPFNKDVSRHEVAQNMNNAMKKIMQKSVSNENPNNSFSKESKCISSKKRKRDDDHGYGSVRENKTSKSGGVDSPVQKCVKSIVTDSDHCLSKKNNLKLPKESSFIVHSEISDMVDGNLDTSVKGEMSKRNSLMGYFSKVSKEEILAKEEKIEMKVKVLIHSPPTTPSKKAKRRSIHSLPGGAASLSKRKVNLKNKLKENVNAIEVMDSEEMKINEKSIKYSSSVQLNANLTKSQSSKACLSPQKSLSLSKCTGLSNSRNPRVRVAKKILSKEDDEQIVENNYASSIRSKGKDSIGTSERSPLFASTQSSSGAEVESPSISQTKALWKLRVCLSPSQLPSTQGTMLEDESDTDEIFLTRKDKKRRLAIECDKKVNQTKPSNKEMRPKNESLSPDILFEKQICSEVKIAPLFTRKAESQARQLFLQSGVPDQVKRVLETQCSFEEQDIEIFPIKSHIQQKDDREWFWNLPSVKIRWRLEETQQPVVSCKFSLSDLTGCNNIKKLIDHTIKTSCKGPEMHTVCALPMDILKPILRLIKKEAHDFKVVNTFKLLRAKLKQEEFSKAAALSALAETQRPKRKSSNRKPANLKHPHALGAYRANMWTEKYKPTTASEIVGNSFSVQQLKRWLEAWRKASEDISRQSSREGAKHKKKRKDAIDDDDDFVVSDISSDVAQSNGPVGVAVLYGPNGSGKTSTVYALAKDLGFKVLEVNASERRNGKLVLSKLSEATQSHQVQQGSTPEQGFAALFGQSMTSAKKKPKTSEIPKCGADSEEEKAKKMSLILFEDVDIVFEEEDEGFLSAISNLVSTSKRPVIVTTTDPESSMVSRFMNNSSLVLQFCSFPNLLSTWLQIVSVLEGIYVGPQAVKDLVSLCQGDFRRALLQMQLWVSSGGNNLPMPSITYASLQGRKVKKTSKTHDTDGISDFEDDDDLNISPSIPINMNCIAVMLGVNDTDEVIISQEKENHSIKIPFPLDMGLYWWNVPPMLSLKQLQHPEIPVVKEDPSVPGSRRMLDEFFVTSFCTDNQSTADSGINADSNMSGSQSSKVGGPVGAHGGQTDNTLNPDSQDLSPYISCCSSVEMEAMFNQMITLSSIDLISVASKLHFSSNMEPMLSSLYPYLKDSLSLVEVVVEGPNCMLDNTSQEICHWLAEQRLNYTRTCMCPKNSNMSSYNYCLPNEEEFRWRSAHANTEQAALCAVPLGMQLEHRAISTDYMPTLRIFCRLERNRSMNNSKRRSRFHHYLKSIGVHVTDAQLELLCHTMCDS